MSKVGDKARRQFAAERRLRLAPDQSFASGRGMPARPHIRSMSIDFEIQKASNNGPKAG
jgi:hypothetical protein